METEKIQLTKDKESYLPTVYGKALDSRSKNPILGDKFADEALGKIDFDFTKIHVKGGEISLPIRAKHFDGWTREFLAANPTATVLHLGCGLDSRVFRIDPPATVRWYDVDMPDVIELRRKIYPDHHDYEMIGSSVTDPHWLDRIPGDRPVIVVAEGLMQYLSEKEAIALLTRITEKFPHGDIIFDAYSSFMIGAMNLFMSIKKAGVSLGWGVGDPHKLEKQVPRLWLIDAVTFLTMPELLERMTTSRAQAMLGRILARLKFYRNMIRHFRYRF
jgi:O-methyltransferase involved in polyketide biosynthesis